jgi:hypothetical protein
MEVGSCGYEQAFWALLSCTLNPGTKQLLSRKAYIKVLLLSDDEATVWPLHIKAAILRMNLSVTGCGAFVVLKCY